MGDFDNDGAMMDVDETLMCKFIKVKHEKKTKAGIQKKATMGGRGMYGSMGRGGFGGTGRGYKGY